MLFARAILLCGLSVLLILSEERSKCSFSALNVFLITLRRFCSMDFAFLSTIMGISILMIVASYDIACQWSKNLKTRVAEFPSSLQFTLPPTLTYVIPKFHIYAHGKSCQTRWSLNYLRWMGRTDGEGVEREWSHINPVALSTRLMGPGHRHDILDDHWGAWNWRKVVGLGT